MGKDIDPGWKSIIRIAKKFRFCEFFDISLDNGIIIFPAEPKTIKVIKRFKSAPIDTKNTVNNKIDAKWEEFITWCCDKDVHKIICLLSLIRKTMNY